MLNDDIREYKAQLEKGQIQRAYKGIMSFMSDLKTTLERLYPDCSASALYYGYMDMTYFAFTPPGLKDMQLKVAVVYLHQEGRFELWLAANNRKLQSEYHARLSQKDLRGYTLSRLEPGVDAIISATITAQPDFDHPEELKRQIEEKTIAFTKDMASLLV
jgi:hypothetical protein